MVGSNANCDSRITHVINVFQLAVNTFEKK